MSQLIKGRSVLSRPPNLISFNYVGWRKGRGITEFMSYSALPSLARTQQVLLKMQSSSSTCKWVLLWAQASCCSSHLLLSICLLTVSKAQLCVMIACHWTGLSAQGEGLLHFNRYTTMTLLAQTPNKVLQNTRVRIRRQLRHGWASSWPTVRGIYFIWGVDGKNQRVADMF